MRNSIRLRPKHLRVFAALVACLVWAGGAYSEVFIQFTGLEGPETVLGKAGHFRATSWSWGETNSVDLRSANDFTLVHPTGLATPKLLELFCSEGGIATATMTTIIQSSPRGAGETKYLQITMEDCLISSYQTGGSAGDVVPTDQITINFAKVTSVYEELSADGSVRVRVERSCDNPARPSQ